MLAPDRIETRTAKPLRRTAAGRALGVPMRPYACQSRIEYDRVLAQHGMRLAEWMVSLDFLTGGTLLPHGALVSGRRHIERPGCDCEIIRDGGAADHAHAQAQFAQAMAW